MSKLETALKLECISLADKGLTVRQIYVGTFLPKHTGMSFDTFSRKMRGAWKKCRPVEEKPVPEILKPSPIIRSTAEYPIGIFSDPHIPFDHPNYLRFCEDTFEAYGVKRIICCGDLVDFHAISRHQTETCAHSVID